MDKSCLDSLVELIYFNVIEEPSKIWTWIAVDLALERRVFTLFDKSISHQFHELGHVPTRQLIVPVGGC